MNNGTWYRLKEKLPQAFMQIGWMEDHSRNLTAYSLANLDQSNDYIWFFKGFITLMYVALSGGTVLTSVMSLQYNCLTELYANFYIILLFMKMYLPSSFMTSVRQRWDECACINPWTWSQRAIDIQVQSNNCENLCTKSVDSCTLVISHILAEFRTEWP